MKSKVEARKSVENKCDYSRMNGKCGRALCENFGKPCPGRTCEDWKCDAEGEVEVVEHRTAAALSGRRGNGGALSAPAAENGGGTVLVGGTVNYRDRVSEQYVAIETAKDNLLRECVKFGALLTEVGYYLGEARGRGEGDGLKAWLAENCPEVNYNTAIGYKALAGKCVKMLGGGSQAVAVLQDKTEVVPPGEEEAIEVESKFIEKRDELFNEVKSRRELEQTYFKFMASERRGKSGKRAGISKGMKADTSGAAVDTTDVYAAARAVWSKVIKEAQATAALKAAAKLLKEADVEDALAVLGDLVEILKERQEVLKAR